MRFRLDLQRNRIVLKTLHSTSQRFQNAENDPVLIMVVFLIGAV